MINFLLTSSALILLVAALRTALKRAGSARFRYALWLLVLLRLMVPVQFGHAPFAAENVSVRLQAVIQDAQRQPAAQEAAAAPQQTGAAQAEAENPAEASAPAQQARPQEKHPAPRLTPKHIWLAGAAACGLWLLLGNLRFARRLKRTRRECLGVSCAQKVYWTDAVKTPCLFGLFRPAVYLTSEAFLDKNALVHVLAHEEVHRAHGDHIWSALRCVCLAVYWFHPLVWLAAELSMQDAELACDEGALRRLGEENRQVYARTLLHFTLPAAAADPTCTATTMQAGKRALRERLEALVTAPKRSLPASAAASALALAATLCCFTGASALPAAPAPEAGAAEPALQPAESQASEPDWSAAADRYRRFSLDNFFTAEGAPEYLLLKLQLLDLDRNGQPELLVYGFAGSGLERLQIFTLEDGHVVRLTARTDLPSGRTADAWPAAYALSGELICYEAAEFQLWDWSSPALSEPALFRSTQTQQAAFVWEGDLLSQGGGENTHQILLFENREGRLAARSLLSIPLDEGLRPAFPGLSEEQSLFKAQSLRREALAGFEADAEGGDERNTFSLRSGDLFSPNAVSKAELAQFFAQYEKNPPRDSSSAEAAQHVRVFTLLASADEAWTLLTERVCRSGQTGAYAFLADPARYEKRQARFEFMFQGIARTAEFSYFIGPDGLEIDAPRDSELPGFCSVSAVAGDKERVLLRLRCYDDAQTPCRYPLLLNIRSGEITDFLPPGVAGIADSLRLRSDLAYGYGRDAQTGEVWVADLRRGELWSLSELLGAEILTDRISFGAAESLMVWTKQAGGAYTLFGADLSARSALQLQTRSAQPQAVCLPNGLPGKLLWNLDLSTSLRYDEQGVLTLKSGNDVFSAFDTQQPLLCRGDDEGNFCFLELADAGLPCRPEPGGAVFFFSAAERRLLRVQLPLPEGDWTVRELSASARGVRVSLAPGSGQAAPAQQIFYAAMREAD